MADLGFDGAGRVSRGFVRLSAGWMSNDGRVTIENGRDHFDQIEDTADFVIHLVEGEHTE
jgi:hypothetical protein